MGVWLEPLRLKKLVCLYVYAFVKSATALGRIPAKLGKHVEPGEPGYIAGM